MSPRSVPEADPIWTDTCEVKEPIWGARFEGSDRKRCRSVARPPRVRVCQDGGQGSQPGKYWRHTRGRPPLPVGRLPRRGLLSLCSGRDPLQRCDIEVAVGPRLGRPDGLSPSFSKQVPRSPRACANEQTQLAFAEPAAEGCQQTVRVRTCQPLRICHLLTSIPIGNSLSPRPQHILLDSTCVGRRSRRDWSPSLIYPPAASDRTSPGTASSSGTRTWWIASPCRRRGARRLRLRRWLP